MPDAIIVVDLGFGDSGKGSIVDFLSRSRRAPCIIRYCGGPQAAHNVITSSGQHHTFAQFGSGMFVPEAITFLSRFMLIDPLSMMNEADNFYMKFHKDLFERTYIDREAIVITPWHKFANKVREFSRESSRHGSCGMGIGETQSDYIKGFYLKIKDLFDPYLSGRLEEIQRRKIEEIQALLMPLHYEELELLSSKEIINKYIIRYDQFLSVVKAVDRDFLRSVKTNLIFEGAQGTLLDENYGFHPYTTWSTVTVQHAETLLKEINFKAGKKIRLGVMRAYMTRHGPGPFVTEDAWLTSILPDKHNEFGEWQRDFRVGWLDFVILKYAIEANKKIDALAVTNVDRFFEFNNMLKKACVYYRNIEGSLSFSLPLPKTLDEQISLTRRLWMTQPGYETIKSHRLLEFIEIELHRKINIVSFGPTAEAKYIRHKF